MNDSRNIHTSEDRIEYWQLRIIKKIKEIYNGRDLTKGVKELKEMAAHIGVEEKELTEFSEKIEAAFDGLIAKVQNPKK